MPELCGARFEPNDRLQCVLPYGHDPDFHEYTVPIPEDIGQVIARALDGYDASRDQYLRAAKRLRISANVLLGVAFLNGGVLVWNMVRWLS